MIANADGDAVDVGATSNGMGEASPLYGTFVGMAVSIGVLSVIVIGLTVVVLRQKFGKAAFGSRN